MNLNPPSIPDYSLPALEDPTFAPQALTGASTETGASGQGAAPRLRFNQPWFQYLQKIRQAMLAFPAAVSGISKAGSATVNAANGIVTTEALATPSGARYTITVSDNAITGQSNVMVNVTNETNTQGAALLQGVTPGEGKVVIDILNVGSQPFNGSLLISFLVF